MKSSLRLIILLLEYMKMAEAMFKLSKAIPQYLLSMADSPLVSVAYGGRRLVTNRRQYLLSDTYENCSPYLFWRVRTLRLDVPYILK